MKKEKTLPEDSSLRQKAEAVIEKLHSGEANPPVGYSKQSSTEAEMQKLIQELQIYQIELEMQNEELQQAVEKAATATALYDFAPTGYFTVRPDSIISQLNLSGAKMLGKERSGLITRSLNHFITPDTLPIFTEFLQKCFATRIKQTCEISLAISEKPRSFLHLEGMVSEDEHKCLVTAVDITERKQAEESLRESKKMYRLLVRNLPGTTVFLFDHQLRYILVEGSLHPDFGFTTELIEGKTLWEVLSEERAARLAPIYSNALQGISTENLISEFKDSFYSVNILPVKNKKGKIIAGMVVSHDITKRKQAEEELNANYSLLRIAGETAKFGGWSINITDNKVTWSDEVASIHEMPVGYSPVLDEGVNFYASEWQGVIASAVADCAKNGIPFDKELELITAKGNRIWVRTIGEAVRDTHGKIFKIQGSFQDISEQRRAEELIRESEERFRSLLQNVSSVSVQGYAPDGTTQYWNKASERLYGYTEEEAIGRNLLDLIIPPGMREDVKQAVKQMAETREPIPPSELSLMRSDGSRVAVYSSHAVVEAPGKNSELFCFDIDITDRKLAEKALQEREARLRELNATKDKFFSIIAHDLKSPFNSIIGFSSLLSRQMQERDYASIEKYAGIIQNSSLHAMDLLMNLLEWSRSQTGRMLFDPGSIDIVELINQTKALLIASALQKSITVYSEMPDNLLVFADKDMISTILRNLISNAIKFTDTGGKIVISTEQLSDELVISVLDSGVGMNSESIGKLFRIEENYSTLGTQKEKGTGLGLLLCKEFIDKHGGRIGVESEPGKGSRFFFSIPNSIAANS